MAATPKETVQNVIDGYKAKDSAKVLAEFAPQILVSGHREGEHYNDRVNLDSDLADEVETAGDLVSGPMADDPVLGSEIKHHGGDMSSFNRIAQVQFDGEGPQDSRWTVVMERFRRKEVDWPQVEDDEVRASQHGPELSSAKTWWLVTDSHFSVPQKQEHAPAAG